MRPGNVDNFSDTKALGGKAVQQTYPNREVGISNIYSLVLGKIEVYVENIQRNVIDYYEGYQQISFNHGKEKGEERYDG